MAARSSSSPPGGGAAVDRAPLLGGDRADDPGRQFRPPRASLRGAANFIRRATGRRRRMREPSVRVREAAAEQIEERQTGWAYSRPVVLLDVTWNLAFVAVAAAVLATSGGESPSVPLRAWIAGYALLCSVHMACACVEYRRRQSAPGAGSLRGVTNAGGGGAGSVGFSVEVEEVSGYGGSERSEDEERTSVVNHLESANTMFSFVWWIIGLYWVSAGGQTLTHDAPHLYWLSAAFLTFDVFFVLFCVGLAFIIGLAVCCCLPCIIAILYAVADQEGASEEDLHQLPKYKFQTTCDFDNFGEILCTFGGIMIECNTETPNERVLSPEDAECCICLSAYDDGVELRQLPCNHHFHCYCVDKWLYINATCPLCKYHILKNGNHGRQSV